MLAVTPNLWHYGIGPKTKFRLFLSNTYLTSGPYGFSTYRGSLIAPGHDVTMEIRPS